MAGILSSLRRSTAALARGPATIFPRLARSVASKPEVDWSTLSADVFDETTLRNSVGNATFRAFEESRHHGTSLSEDVKKDIVNAIRKWAEARGVVTYTHWFSPLRDTAHGTKVNTFIQKDFSKHKQNVIQGGLSVAQFFQTETDGSSYPNGGLRATHTAAAYVSWDMNSPLFIFENILYIPSCFVSWTGEALDYKTPLLRSNQAVAKEAMRVLSHLGDTNVKEVISNVGWEQEFFVIDREMYDRRPDIQATGRTLFGGLPLKGQELSSDYFGRIPTRVREYLDDVRARMWRTGVSIDCFHNEVAPGQHECAPIFTVTNVAADQNVLLLDTLKSAAADHGLAVLFHEKPFKGINGSGKHNNWGLNTDTGLNLFVAGKNARDERRFVTFIAAMTRAIHMHGDVLRTGVSSAAQEFRLGAHEAPPPLLTLYMGEDLEAHLRSVAAGGPMVGAGHRMGAKVITGVAPSVQDIKASPQDRNRTAPFPWCGNRFEFRAVGSSQHIAFPLTMVNVAVADALKHMADEMDKGKSVETVVRETLDAHKGALFSGNGYDAELLASIAKKENLHWIKTTPEAFQVMSSPKNVKLFTEHKVFNEREIHARQNVLLDNYATTILIETRTLLKLTKTGIIPAVLNCFERNDDVPFELPSFKEQEESVKRLAETAAEITKAIKTFEKLESELERANFARDTLRVLCNKARVEIDFLESEIDADKWPYPDYFEILRSHHD